ncbi:MAG: hypothetical protein ACTSQJ_06595 [Promethearchaeota archaeon]
MVGFLAFFITQYGFAKGADASKLVPIFNSFYIITPIIFELVIVEDSEISIFMIASIAIIIIGICLMFLNKTSEDVLLKKLEFK